MILAGLAKSSTVDFPGMLSAVLFTPGCNLDCFYCHNRALLNGQAPELDKAEVMGFLEKRRHLLDGVVFSGGEPTLQDGLIDMVAEIRHLGYKIKLDTNGTRTQVLNQLLDNRLLDYIAVDCKAPWSRYPEICGCSPEDVEAVRRSFRLLEQTASAGGCCWEARTTVIPQLSPSDLLQIAASLPPAPHFFLQRYIKPVQFRPADRFRLDAPGMTAAQLVLLAEKLRPIQPNIQIR